MVTNNEPNWVEMSLYDVFDGYYNPEISDRLKKALEAREQLHTGWCGALMELMELHKSMGMWEE